KWGFRLGAEQFVAGVDVDSVLASVKNLNEKGISATVDHLGEFITERSKSMSAKKNILELINQIYEEKIECHISVKLTQLGIDITDEFCLANMQEILGLAHDYGIFINIDMEDYLHYEHTLHTVDHLRQHYDNVVTGI